MKKIYKNKLLKVIDILETINWDMDIEKDEIENKAYAKDRDLTEREEEKIEELEEAIEAISDIISELEELAD